MVEHQTKHLQGLKVLKLLNKEDVRYQFLKMVKEKPFFKGVCWEELSGSQGKTIFQWGVQLPQLRPCSCNGCKVHMGMTIFMVSDSRLGFARTLANEPEVLLLDEPTSALDPISTHNIFGGRVEE